jgi:hypothetical protein
MGDPLIIPAVVALAVVIITVAAFYYSSKKRTKTKVDGGTAYVDENGKTVRRSTR